MICNSNNPEGIVQVLAGQRVGTKFYPATRSLRGRKRWILSVRRPLVGCCLAAGRPCPWAAWPPGSAADGGPNLQQAARQGWGWRVPGGSESAPR